VKSRAFVACCVVFLGWFAMKFHMDTANDSETHAYVGTLLWNVEHATATADATGHYTGLAPYLMWSLASLLGLVTRDYEVRGLVLTLFLLGIAVFGLAYAWYRRLGLSGLTSLLGLVLLSVSAAFAMLVHGWEIDKLIEPALFLLAALAAWSGRYVVFVVVAALAAANRETGVFIPLVALAALIEQRGGVRSALRQWPVWVAATVCVLEVVWLRSLLPLPSVRPWSDLSLDRLVYVAGGVCLVPVLAVAWRAAASVGLRWLLYLLGPIWLVFVLATDHLEQGALLLAPLAVACIPITLAGLEQLWRPAPAPSARADTGVPAVPAAR
jgi:hypothetical protein